MLSKSGPRPLVCVTLFVLFLITLYTQSFSLSPVPAQDEPALSQEEDIKSRARAWIAAAAERRSQKPLIQDHVIYHDHDHPASGLQPGEMQVAAPPLVPGPPIAEPDESRPPPGDKIIVVGKLTYEDASWVTAELPDWQHAIYIVDDPSAPLHTTRNKGHEGNAYLTYIIDHYPSFPSTIVFTHSHRQSWHVDAPDNLNPLTIQTLQIPYVQTHGYANLRCNWEPGCPDELKPYRDWSVPNATLGKEIEYPEVEQNFRSVWTDLFNNTDVPETVAVGCCAQFAVSREQVLKRPREEYEWYLRYMNESPIPDQVLGRVFEYLWHIIFGRDAVHCPGPYTCYKEVFGREVTPSMELPNERKTPITDALEGIVPGEPEMAAPQGSEAVEDEEREEGEAEELEEAISDASDTTEAEEGEIVVSEELESTPFESSDLETSEDLELETSEDSATIVPMEFEDNTLG